MAYPNPVLVLADGLSREFLMHRGFTPSRFAEDGTLVVAAADDAFLDDVDELSALYHAPLAIERASREEIERLIEKLAAAADRTLEVTAADTDGDDALADIRSLADQPPVVRYVNLIVREAFEGGASDIHLEATRTGLVARLRLDGVLTPAPEPPAGMHLAVVSRIKLLARLDIAERRRPQDGRIRVRMERRELDLRVSTVPTMHGESVVLRLLEQGGRPVTLDQLGMHEGLLETVLRLAERPHGMILATGPTGSGKTTTLYAALQHRDAATEKIITVEDPVEYQLEGITQVPVHREAGTTFATALRSILRQDPDVLMVGEMRDRETAELAVQAAMTGHLVFSTLHTGDAIGAVPRMLDLGVPSYLVAATVEAVVAQRLVRKLCDACRVPSDPPPELLTHLTGSSTITSTRTLYRGAGCPDCRGTGYRGRIGLFELLVMTDDLREAVTRTPSRTALRAAAAAQGTRTIRQDGWRKVLAGLTSVEEVLRVTEG